MNELITSETIDALVEAVRAWIGKKEKIEEITLHGSRVFGTPNPGDWDVVVWVDRPIEGHNEKFDWDKRSERIFQGRAVDLRLRSMDDWPERQTYYWLDGVFTLPLVNALTHEFEDGDQDAFLEAKAEHVRQVEERREKERQAGLAAKREKS